MARLDVLGTINDPGTPGKSGDDRFGFDAAAGRAWVFDGATDVSPLRPFPSHESGAAWYADALSSWMLTHAPDPDDFTAYWREALSEMRQLAGTHSNIPLASLPIEASPIAAGVTVTLVGDRAVFHWLGDCMAFVKTGNAVVPIGAPEASESETEHARQLNKLSHEARWDALREDRKLQNTPGRWIFGLDPRAADHVNVVEVPVTTGTEIILMSDGLYRLIDPYGSHAPEDLFKDADGLMGLLRSLRAIEAGGELADTRVKVRDDACGVWLRILAGDA